MADIKVLIADDHAVFRQGMIALLDHVDGITVVGEAPDGESAVRQATRLRPDVILMDLTMPHGGVAATATVTARANPPAVLVLSMHSEHRLVRAALRAGARGYLLKDADADSIVRAIQAVASGQAIFSDHVVEAAVGSGTERADYPFPDLTPRERDVLDRLARGLSSTAIAERLGLSTKTVQNITSRILVKLSARDRAEAVALARDAGLRGSP